MKRLAWLLVVVFAVAVQMVRANEVVSPTFARHQSFISSGGSRDLAVIFNQSFVSLSAGQGRGISKPVASSDLVPAAVDPRLNGRPTVTFRAGGRGAPTSYLGSECVVTPEPGTLLLTASGLAALVGRFRRRKS